MTRGLILQLAAGLALLGALWAWPPPAAADAGFFAALEDVPIPPGLAEPVPDDGFVFEGAAGRILEAAASGQGRAADISAFYREALPALGWTEPTDALTLESLQFERGRELLIVQINEGPAPGRARVRVRLLVRPAALSLD